jgi:nucleoside-diphosphate-sugar epimerase
VVVTGGSGYLGSRLVERLGAAGDRVVNFDLEPPDDQPGVEFVRGDVRDRGALRAACAGADVIIHGVALQPLARDRRLMEDVNVGGTSNLLASALDAKVRKVVYVSSTSVFGIPERNPLVEDSPLRPLEPYGRSKLQAELLCRDAVERGVDVTVIRPRTIVGPGRLGLFSILFDWISEGAPIYVLGRGDNQTNFIHLEDLASACILAAQREGAATYNVGATEVDTMREMLQALVDHAGTGASVRSLPKRPAILAMRALSTVGLAPFAPYHWLLYGEPIWFDSGRARGELGWEPEKSNVEMMIESYDWFLANRDSLRYQSDAHGSLLRQRMLRLLKLMGRVV